MMTVAHERDYYTVAEAAAVLDVSTSTVLRWIKSGLLSAYRTGPKSIRIKKDDLNKVVRPANNGDTAEARQPWERFPIEMTYETGLTVRRLTEAELEAAKVALEAADKVQAMILARRGGKPLSSSAPLIRKARAERSRQLLP